MRILTKHLFKEFFPNLILGLGVFTFILIMNKLFEMMNLLLNKGVGLLNVSRLILYILPGILSLTVPMAFLWSTLFLFGRLSEDREIVAIKSAGINTGRFSSPLIIFGLFVSIFLIYFNNEVVPKSYASFRELYCRIVYKNPILTLEENRFLKIGNYSIYSNSVDRKKALLKNLIMYKWSEGEYPIIITAKESLCALAEEKGLFFSMKDGTIQQTDKREETKKLFGRFKTNQIFIDLETEISLLPSRAVGLKELRSSQLKKDINFNPEKKNLYTVELNLRNAIAVSTFVFIILAISSGVDIRKGPKGKSFGLSLIIIFVYYVLLVSGITLGEKGKFNPVISVWLGNIACGLFGIFLFYKKVIK